MPKSPTPQISVADVEAAEAILRVARGNPSRGQSGFASADEAAALERVIAVARASLLPVLAPVTEARHQSSNGSRDYLVRVVVRRAASGRAQDCFDLVVKDGAPPSLEVAQWDTPASVDRQNVAAEINALPPDARGSDGVVEAYRGLEYEDYDPENRYVESYWTVERVPVGTPKPDLESIPDEAYDEDSPAPRA